MDTDDVEVLNLNAFGGADTVTINDLTGTDVTAVNIDLGVTGAGDAGADVVIVNGTAAADVVQAVAAGAYGAGHRPDGSGERDILRGGQRHALTINGLGGNDTLSGGALAAL